MSAMEVHGARDSLPELTNYPRKAKLSLLLSSAAYSGRSGHQIDIRDFTSRISSTGYDTCSTPETVNNTVC